MNSNILFYSNYNRSFRYKRNIIDFNYQNQITFNNTKSNIKPIFQQNRNLEPSKEIDEQNSLKRYQPPSEHPSIKSDVFAMGIIFHQLLTEKLPERIKIINNQPIWNPLLKLQNENDERMKKLLKSMLQLEHQKRISVQQLAQNKLLCILYNKDLIQEIQQKITNCPSLNYFQTAILTFMISKFQAQESKIIKQLFQILDQDNNNNLQESQLEQVCKNTKVNTEDLNIDPQETKDKIDLINNGKRISENEFLISLSNRDKLLTEEYLENTFNQLKNSNGLLGAKSINRKIYIDQNILLNDLEKILQKLILFYQLIIINYIIQWIGINVKQNCFYYIMHLQFRQQSMNSWTQCNF